MEREVRKNFLSLISLPVLSSSHGSTPFFSQKNNLKSCVLWGSPASVTQSSVTPKVLRYRDAAIYMGISHGRLRNLVSEGRGPASVTYGKRDRAFPIAALNGLSTSGQLAINLLRQNPSPSNVGQAVPARPNNATRNRWHIGP